MASGVSGSMSYWLEEWLDENGIRTLPRAKTLLEDRVIRQDLHDRALASVGPLDELSDADGPILVAGRPMDLSGDLDCLHAECVKRQADGLFAKVLHYFDKIVVSAVDGSRFAALLERLPDRDPAAYLEVLNRLEILLYLREIGATDFLIFRTKPALCEDHIRETLASAGVSDTSAEMERLREKFAKEGAIRVEDSERSRTSFAGIEHPMFKHIRIAGIQHPMFEHGYNRVTLVAQQPERFDSEDFIRSVVYEVFAYLASDVRAAMTSRAPLGATSRFHQELISSAEGRSVEDVAFCLELPVLQGLDSETLIKLRRDETPSFERFRAAIKKSIEERLKLGDRPARSIANEIRSDLIEPELAQIRNRLRTAKDLLTKKSGRDLALVVLATALGHYVQNPLLAPFATYVPWAYAGKRALQAHDSYLDEKRDVSLADMYFLFRAEEEGRSP